MIAPIPARGMNAPIKRPLMGLAMMEPLRFAAEAWTTTLTWPLLATAPRGDGHAVMVLPGFATSDAMTVLLRWYLASLGYDVHGWELGWNMDQHAAGENGEHVARRIADLAALSGRKVSLVGWSLGGVIAREAARRDHGSLRQVIALGSPFTGDPSATSLSTAYEWLTGNSVGSDDTRARYAEGHLPLPVPSSAIFSRTDGVTAWQNCVSETDARTEVIEVHASHFGMVSNPAVFWAVADRLAQAEGQWAPFTRKGPFAALFP